MPSSERFVTSPRTGVLESKKLMVRAYSSAN
jgi:hypothetical protein